MSVSRPAVFVAVAASVGATLGVPSARAQDLAPRAYVITPLGSNAVTIGNSYNQGELLFEGTVPITGSRAKLDVPSMAYYRSFALFGRSANVLLAAAYGVGTFSGTVLGTDTSIYRSGLADAAVRVSVNLVGGPAMTLPEMRKWKQRALIGVSLKVIAPTGQYDPTKLINLGSNRWTFKPELGLSRAWQRWELDAYGAAWFFTRNPEFFSNNALVSGTHAQTQEPIGTVELHFSYDVRPRLWVGLDGNFWYGGRTSVDGVQNPKTLQKNSRVGITTSLPLTRHQSVKLSYARGAYIRFGGDYRIFSVAWQYSWFDGRATRTKP